MKYKFSKDGNIIPANGNAEWIQDETGHWVQQSASRASDGLVRSYPKRIAITTPVSEERMNKFERFRKKCTQSI